MAGMVHAPSRTEGCKGGITLVTAGRKGSQRSAAHKARPQALQRHAQGGRQRRHGSQIHQCIAFGYICS